MKKDNRDKTNVMRLLDSRQIPYTPHSYPGDAPLSGVAVAEYLGLDPARVFKTLVTVGASGQHYVFVIPSDQELDLKKAARAAGEKNIAMVRSKELLGLTGYVHGGCSPIGMKKPFPTFFDETAVLYDTILFSGGRIGEQVEMSYADLAAVIAVKLADLCTAQTAGRDRS
jgi:Cys-tRNA(Pro)/Cys-tRNA(Cys) deacylase